MKSKQCSSVSEAYTWSMYEGKSLNNRNFILKCMEKYAQWKILFRDTKWLLNNKPYRGRDDQAVWACAIAHTTWPLLCQFALWKSNEALFIFLWSEGMKPSDIYRRMKVQFGAIGLSLVWTYERTFEGTEVYRWRRSIGGGAKLVKGHAKQLFSRGHPQACGQVDQVCCEAGGLCRKIRQKQFL